jgi:hypothetical protein
MGRPKTTARCSPPRRPVDKEAAVAHALGGDEDALCVHDVEDVAWALALLPDQVPTRHLHAVELELAREVVHHYPAALHFQAVADVPEVRYEDREALGAPLHLLDGRRAGERDHKVRVLDAGDVDLAPAHHVAVSTPLREGRDARRVGARLGLGDADGLQPELAGGYLRQVLPLLVLGAVRSSVSITYIWAWAGLALASPERLASSRIAQAAVRSRPMPPYSSGMRAAR